MSHRFIALVAATALAVTAFGNAPARADEDLAKALVVLFGAAVLGKIVIDKANEDDDEVTRRAVNSVRDLGYVRPSSNLLSGRFKPRPLPDSVRRRLLPGDCLRSFETRDRRYRVFGKKCLEKNYAYARNLPKECKVKFKTYDKKKRQGYDARCLRREGYQLARR